MERTPKEKQKDIMIAKLKHQVDSHHQASQLARKVTEPLFRH